ncbi:hypothetical protein [Demequina maris]|uniref:hypothetical protein n=1 Tax=Demequina maris TaxID=1638982 RepID=UPI00078203CF|nr:hypothetical protein [Demequina maris]
MGDDEHVDYDALSPAEQAAMRGVWQQRMAELAESDDLLAEFEAAGRSYSEADADGNVIIHHPKRPDPSR